MNFFNQFKGQPNLTLIQGGLEFLPEKGQDGNDVFGRLALFFALFRLTLLFEEDHQDIQNAVGSVEILLLVHHLPEDLLLFLRQLPQGGIQRRIRQVWGRGRAGGGFAGRLFFIPIGVSIFSGRLFFGRRLHAGNGFSLGWKRHLKFEALQDVFRQFRIPDRLFGFMLDVGVVFFPQRRNNIPFGVRGQGPVLHQGPDKPVQFPVLDSALKLHPFKAVPGHGDGEHPVVRRLFVDGGLPVEDGALVDVDPEGVVAQ